MSSTKTLRVQTRGVVTLPKRLRTRVGIADGSLVNVSEREGGILIKPVSRLDPTLLDDVRKSLEDFKTGNYIEFSSIEEFHDKRRKKWKRKA